MTATLLLNANHVEKSQFLQLPKMYLKQNFKILQDENTGDIL